MSEGPWFAVGDVITIGNADRPVWAGGLWRVVELAGARVRLVPLTADGGVDVARATRMRYWIADGGLTATPRSAS